MYYGYVIMAVLCFDYLIMLCGSLYTYGSYVMPMIQSLSMSMTQASLGQTILSLSSSVLGLLVGRLLTQNMKPKQCILIGGAAGMLGSLIMAFLMKGPVLYYLCFAVFISTMNVCGAGVASHLIASKWFPENRSTALAILFSMGGVGGFIFPMMTVNLTNASGSWRTIWVVVFAGCALSFLLLLLFLHNSTEEMNVERPKENPVRDENYSSTVYRTEIPFTCVEALKTPYFYASTLMMICMSMGVYAMSNTMVVHLTDRGFTAEAASRALSIYAACNIIGRLSSGPIFKRVNPRTVQRICLIGMSSCFALTPFIVNELEAYFLAAIMGIFISFGVMCPMNMTMNTYGVKYYSQIYSVQTMANTLLNSIATLSAGTVHDRTGSYVSYFYILIAVSLAVFLMQILIKEPVKKKQKEC